MMDYEKTKKMVEEANKARKKKKKKKKSIFDSLVDAMDAKKPHSGGRKAAKDFGYKLKDGGTAKSAKLDALKSLMGKKKPDMIKATVMAKDPEGLYEGAEKLEEVAESMGAKKKKKTKDDDVLSKLKKLLKK